MASRVKAALDYRQATRTEWGITQRMTREWAGIGSRQRAAPTLTWIVCRLINCIAIALCVLVLLSCRASDQPTRSMSTERRADGCASAGEEASSASACAGLSDVFAIEIAKAYLEQNWGANLADQATYEADVLCYEGRWMVTIYGLPRAPGRHTMVIVGMSGEVEGVIPGR